MTQIIENLSQNNSSFRSSNSCWNGSETAEVLFTTSQTSTPDCFWPEIESCDSVVTVNSPTAPKNETKKSTASWSTQSRTGMNIDSSTTLNISSLTVWFDDFQSHSEHCVCRRMSLLWSDWSLHNNFPQFGVGEPSTISTFSIATSTQAQSHTVPTPPECPGLSGLAPFIFCIFSGTVWGLPILHKFKKT